MGKSRRYNTEKSGKRTIPKMSSKKSSKFQISYNISNKTIAFLSSIFFLQILLPLLVVVTLFIALTLTLGGSGGFLFSLVMLLREYLGVVVVDSTIDTLFLKLSSFLALLPLLLFVIGSRFTPRL